MVRSSFAATRLIVAPYGVLLVLYFVIVGGGGAWLYHQVRIVETRLLIDEVTSALKPLVDKLGAGDAASAMRQRDAWLMDDLRTLFASIPSLRNVSVRGPDAGFKMIGGRGVVASRDTLPLPADTRRGVANLPPAQRLHSRSDREFLISYDLTPATASLIKLDFGFDRSVMLARIENGVSMIKRSIIGFVVVGALSILLALAITVVAMRVARRVEGHFQEIYQRASITEMAAQLVHDLRNPLAALRANVKALLVSPEQTREIVDELDQDIVTLNDKLSAFLNLTRRHDNDLEPVEISELIGDAVRLAEPILEKHGLSVETDIPPGLPRIALCKASMRDALLNVLVNASQSGQKNGVIRVSVRADKGAISIATEDWGTGIPNQHLPHLFDAFYTTRADGNGLGLAIVQRVVAAHEGRVYAENRPQGGARVVINLPLQTKETPAWWNRLKKTSPV